VSEPHAQEWERFGRRSVDLHWRIPGVGIPAERAWDVLAARTVPIAIGNIVGEALTRPGVALLVALHAAHHGTTATQPLSDLERALGQVDEDTWAEAARLASELDASEAFAAGLRLAPEGERLAGRLHLPPVSSPRRRLMAADQPPGSLGVLGILEAPTARRRMRAIGAGLLPGPDFMRAEWSLARRGRAGLVLAYVARLLARAWQLPAAIRAVRWSQRTTPEPPPEPGRRPRTPLPRLVIEAVRLAWQAGPRELAAMAAAQLVTLVGVVVTALVARSLLSGLLDADRTGGDVGDLVPKVLELAALTAGLGVAQAVQLHRQRVLSELCTRHAEDRVLAVTGAVELAAFDDPRFHDAVERAHQAVLRLPAVVGGLSGVLGALAGTLGAVIALGAIAPVFAPVVLLVFIPLWLAARSRSRAFYGFARGITPRDRERRYLSRVLAERDAAKEIRAFGLVDLLGARRARLWDERIGKLRGVADRQLALNVAANVAASAVVSGTLLALVALTLADEISLAAAGTAAVMVVFLGQRLVAAATSGAVLSETALFIDDYLALVELGQPAPREPAAGGDVPRALHVRAENVSFSYAGARGRALNDVSLEIAPSEVVALVGENGSGKTTLAKLLAALYVPERGRVTLNGADTAHSDRDELRRGVAVIFQDFIRYALPAFENIALGRHENADDVDGVRRAARVAGAHDDLERLPHGYETILDPAFEAGTDLSVGQWQRVALARALFRDAPFVILDEPTAALDARAEHDLFARIRELLRGRSVLLISHRFPSVRMADRIHVMHAGAIVESGTHDELIARGGRYAELFALQAEPYR
jgi:ATP-binding cassette subfamily B protein